MLLKSNSQKSPVATKLRPSEFDPETAISCLSLQSETTQSLIHVVFMRILLLTSLCGPE